MDDGNAPIADYNAGPGSVESLNAVAKQVVDHAQGLAFLEELVLALAELHDAAVAGVQIVQLDVHLVLDGLLAGGRNHLEISHNILNAVVADIDIAVAVGEAAALRTDLGDNGGDVEGLLVFQRGDAGEGQVLLRPQILHVEGLSHLIRSLSGSIFGTVEGEHKRIKAPDGGRHRRRGS